MAQEERIKASKRTKDALAAARARGVKLGTPHTNALATWNKEAAINFAERMRPVIERYRKRGIVTVRGIVHELNKRKIPTYRGRGRWHITSVYAVLNRLRNRDHASTIINNNEPQKEPLNTGHHSYDPSE